MTRLPRSLSVVLLLAFTAATTTAQAEIKLPSVVGSDMVLQQGSGRADLGLGRFWREITVGFAGQSQRLP